MPFLRRSKIYSKLRSNKLKPSQIVSRKVRNDASTVILLALPCETVCSGICGQRRPRSACASAQSDQGLRCPLTDSLDTTEYMSRAKARMIRCACAGPRMIWLHILRIFEGAFSLDAAVRTYGWRQKRNNTWAGTQQFLQNDLVRPAETQPAHPRCLIRGITVRMKKRSILGHPLHLQSKTSNVCSEMTGQWSDRSAMSSRRALSPLDPVSYLRGIALRSLTSFLRREGSAGMDVWNAPMVQPRQPLTYRLMESVGLVGPRWHGSSWQRGMSESENSRLLTLMINIPGDLVWDQPCVQQASYLEEGWGQWCGCCPCTCTLIKNPMMMIIHTAHSEDIDQTTRLCRLIRVFDGSTYNIVRNAVPWLRCQYV